MQKKQFGWSALPFILIFFCTILEFHLEDFIVNRSYPYETEKKLVLLEEKFGIRAVECIIDKLKRAIRSFNPCDQERISGTVHIKVKLEPLPEKEIRAGLLQLTNYVNISENGIPRGDKGRITTLDQGIIGRCVRTGKIEYVNFADEAEYMTRMVTEFGFTIPEAKNHDILARSYIAVPLIFKSDVIGVLYFFPQNHKYFRQLQIIQN
ncbi:MAG: GAF domain-containing protein [bacterium]